MTISAGRAALAMARIAMNVLPLPVGSTTTPRPRLTPPGFDGFGLVRERLTLHPQWPGCLLPGTGVVGVIGFVRPQLFDDGSVITALGPVGVGPRVEAHARQVEQAIRRPAGDDERVGVEGESDDLGGHTGITDKWNANRNGY